MDGYGSISRPLALSLFRTSRATGRHLADAVNWQFYSVLLHFNPGAGSFGYQPNDKEHSP